jgi:predicted flap endonuclease-1-like 5' DNA nuclease
MTDATASLEAAALVSASALGEYLKHAGWSSQRSRARGMTIYAKTFPGADEPIRILLPETPRLDEGHRRVADALRTIEVIEERPILAIVDNVREIARKRNSTLARKPRVTSKRRARSTSYSLADISGIGPLLADKLKICGIKTTHQLLEVAKTMRGRETLAAAIGVDEKTILRSANLVDRMRIKGVGEDYAKLLAAVGVDTVNELKHRNVVKLAAAMREANEKNKLVRLLPSERRVRRWIEHAKQLPLKITY